MTKLANLIDNHLAYCRNVRRLSDNTVRAYKNDLTHFSVALETREQLTPHTIQERLKNIAEDVRLAPRTVKRRIAAIRSFIRAINGELAATTFATWKLAIRSPACLPRAIAKSELSALLKLGRRTSSHAEETTHLCVSLLAATGLRVSELCALRVGDVRSHSGEIIVMGKGSRERVAIIANAKIRQAVARHVDKLNDKNNSTIPLFRNQRGRQMTPQCLRLRLHALVDRSQVTRKITPHMLRHTAATLLIEGGLDIRFVQRLLGQANIATTQIYTHVTDTALRAALERVDVMRPFT